jgi:hypothetical protein
MSMDIANKELDGRYYKSIYKQRFEAFGPHPYCADCLKVNICLVANVPGYEFTCNEKMVAGTQDRGGRLSIAAPLPAPSKKNKRHGGW